MWFDLYTGILIGSIGGSAVGVFGGTLGAMAGVFSRKGKFKKFILTSMIILMILGVISLCAGVIALMSGQPYHVWYPFTILGVILPVVEIPGYIAVKKGYAQAELKKMSVDDLG
jgi:ABC-type dipeptide/oligopeptide/nickel transport system permease subunit